MKETWKPVYRHEGLYEVSDTGSVRAVSREVNSRYKTRTLSAKTLKPSLDKDGYLAVSLYKDGKAHRKRVSRLVAEAFLGVPSKFMEVNHKDENVRNNNVSNLEWCDRTYNNNYGTRTLRSTLSRSKPLIATGIDGAITIFPSVSSLKIHGYANRSVYRCLKGIRKHYRNMTWKYLNDMEETDEHTRNY